MQLHLAGFMLAISVPLGFYITHSIAPFLWWIEVKTLISLQDKTGPNIFVILLGIIICWGILYALANIIIGYYKQYRSP